MKFLLEYVNKHFSHEEALQKQSGYPGYQYHRTFHENYKEKLRDIANAIPAAGPTVSDLGKLNAHIAVLVSHIRNMGISFFMVFARLDFCRKSKLFPPCALTALHPIAPASAAIASFRPVTQGYSYESLPLTLNNPASAR